MLRYAVTSSEDAGPVESSITQERIAKARRWAAEGMDYVQLRERQLQAGELVRLAAAMQAALLEYGHGHGGRTKLLVNGRADVAVAAGADGVHLTSRPGELTAEQVRRVFAASGSREPVVSASCHTVAEVQRAIGGRVDLILFGPVFEKRVAGEVVAAGVGLEALREACKIAGVTPVLALGGVTKGNAALCVEAGAAGIAGIRLFSNEAKE
jgi:thiamine-phosphate pyrophosphorylase